MGGDFEGVDEDGRNFVGLWYDVKWSGIDSASVWQKKLGGDEVDVEDMGGVPPPGGQTYHEDDREFWGGQEVEISPVGGGTVIGGIKTRPGVHLEMTDENCVTGGMPPRL